MANADEISSDKDNRYRPQDIEPKWQKTWEETKLYRTSEGGDKPKFYCLDFFPYPSGAGLTVGHYRNYVPTDAISRFKRMRGFNVLHPMGWDAFGQPAETEAVTKKRHPRPMVTEYIGNYKRQLRIGGFCYDWEREINSSDAGVLPLDTVALPAALQARPGLSHRGAGQLVPQRRPGAGQRGGQRRQVLALRQRGHQEEPGAVVLPHHRLRRSPGR